MSTDRALLEAAAKAAGVHINIEWQGHPDWNPDWNPLTDDGDALRLAVKLSGKIVVFWEDDDGRPATRVGFWPNGSCEIVSEAIVVHGDDPYAATRRAIVRAAASMAPQEKAPPCRGTACGTTTGEHSAECVAEHARAVAGLPRA